MGPGSQRYAAAPGQGRRLVCGLRRQLSRPNDRHPADQAENRPGHSLLRRGLFPGSGGFLPPVRRGPGPDPGPQRKHSGPGPEPDLAGACQCLRRQHRRCGAADRVHFRGLGAAGPYALQPLSPASGHDGRAGVLPHFLGPQAPGAPASPGSQTAPSPSGSRRSYGWSHGRRSPSAPVHTAPSAPV